VPSLIRADIRVLWLRDLGPSPANGLAFCAPGGDAVATTPPPDPATYHALYLTTAIVPNPAP
jgi:hypothetical protein